MERRMETVTRAINQDQRGFSLIEVLAAITILMVGLLPLAALFAAGVQQMAASTPMMVAREKAREAIESVHAARDTGNASWDTIQNEANGGVFDDNAVAIKDPGPDGLVNTDDDGADLFPASMYTREIDILPVMLDPPQPLIPNPNLREIRVTVRYRVNQAWRNYTVVSYITPFS
jgi:prepilin-type N-terminal cleavage/methylation domain-containing protein